jgi:hypothetical protein
MDALAPTTVPRAAVELSQASPPLKADRELPSAPSFLSWFLKSRGCRGVRAAEEGIRGAGAVVRALTSTGFIDVLMFCL